MFNDFGTAGSLDDLRNRVYRLQETNWDTDPLNQFVYHPFYIDAVALRDYDADTNGSSVRYYYLYDVTFNVTALVDDTGVVVERYHYDSYDKVSILDEDFSADGDGVSGVANEYTFTGRRFDSDTGLFFFNFRFYHAQLGRFISRDPIGYVDGMSLYRAYFVPGVMDPSGESPLHVYWAIRIGLALVAVGGG